MNKLQSIGFWFKKHSPEILLVTGIVSFAGSVISACVATKKFDKTVESDKEYIAEFHEELEKVEANDPEQQVLAKKLKSEIRKGYAKMGLKIAAIYSPAAILFSLGLGCTLGSHKVMSNRNVALAAAYSTLKTGYDAYRDRIKEKLGEEAEKALYSGKEEKEVTEKDEKGKNVVKKVNMITSRINSDFTILFDETCGLYDHDGHLSTISLIQAEDFANLKLRSKGYLFLSEVYEYLGVSASTVGERKMQASHVLGWVYDPTDDSRDNYVSFGIRHKDGRYTDQLTNLDQGTEDYIFLDFNVDGDILTGDNGKKKFTEVAVKKS